MSVINIEQLTLEWLAIKDSKFFMRMERLHENVFACGTLDAYGIFEQ